MCLKYVTSLQRHYTTRLHVGVLSTVPPSTFTGVRRRFVSGGTQDYVSYKNDSSRSSSPEVLKDP